MFHRCADVLSQAGEPAPRRDWIFPMPTAVLKLCAKFVHLLTREEGQDLVEYALVVALLALSAISGTRSLGTALNHAFTNISSTLSSSLS